MRVDGLSNTYGILGPIPPNNLEGHTLDAPVGNAREQEQCRSVAHIDNVIDCDRAVGPNPLVGYPRLAGKR